MFDGWLSLREAGEETGIPARTLRRYIERHPDFLRTRKDGRNYYLAIESLATARFIRESYDQGANLDQVEEVLATQFPRTLTVVDNGHAQVLTPIQAITRMAEEMMELREELLKSAREQAVTLERLHEDIDQRDTDLRQWLAERLPTPEAKRLSLLVRVKKMLMRDR